MSIETPWGVSQHITDYGEGIQFVTTASHGGFFLSHEAIARMPESLRAIRPWAGNTGWYEEDCDWSLVALSFPELFGPNDLMRAIYTAATQQKRGIWQIDVCAVIAANPLLETKAVKLVITPEQLMGVW